ncbi:Hypothetical protein HVR_LOCUS358 [uncultured virus]|nr:Hypothetical protein HVR_LOCUS358 [uncultured virus]
MTVPTVIVNAYDLIWYDVNILPYDPSPFFFKNDPVTYLHNLTTEGWTICVYAESPTDEIARTRTRINPKIYLTAKLRTMEFIFKRSGTINFIFVKDLPNIIKNANFSSFAIIDPIRPFYEGIARYSPIEIFELVDPPTVSPNTIVTIVNMSNIKRRERMHEYFTRIGPVTIYTVGGRTDYRLRNLNDISTKNPGKSILVVWSPVYRYSRKRQGKYILNFGRPDQLNIPGVAVYAWGY